jgi:hypothetical protein
VAIVPAAGLPTSAKLRFPIFFDFRLLTFLTGDSSSKLERTPTTFVETKTNTFFLYFKSKWHFDFSDITR